MWKDEWHASATKEAKALCEIDLDHADAVSWLCARLVVATTNGRLPPGWSGHRDTVGLHLERIEADVMMFCSLVDETLYVTGLIDHAASNEYQIDQARIRAAARLKEMTS